MGEFFKNPEKNYTELSTEKADYKIAYGDHTLEQDDSPMINSDGLLLEMVQDTDDSSKFVEDFKRVSSKPQQKKSIEYSMRHKKPVFIIDISSTIVKQTQMTEKYMGFVASEIFLAGIIGNYLSRKKISRRDFLGKSIKGALGTVAGWATLPAIEGVSLLPNMAGLIREDSLYRKAQKKLIKIDEKTHPELYKLLHLLRNLIFAQKAETIAEIRRGEIGTKPKLAIILGIAHSGIEETLKMKEEDRIQAIKELLKGVDTSGLEKILKITNNSDDQEINPKFEIKTDEKLRFIFYR